jgi:putative intracellular protease/amidase/YHS domain-containing protein
MLSKIDGEGDSRSNGKDTMNRRNLLKSSLALSVASAIPAMAATKLFAGASGDAAKGSTDKNQPEPKSNQLVPPADGNIPVAFVISGGAVIIDFCGPWEVFEGAGCETYTVAESLNPIKASGGMQIIPNYTFATAPAPKVIVIPAQNGASDAALQWIRTSTKTTDVTMSVCTGAFILARTGLLSGKSATTFHEAFDRFETQFPDIQLKRGARFVEDGNLATSGGLTSGIDLAFRVVERYYGREQAEKLAFALEYQGKGWMNANSNEAYAKFKTAVSHVDGRPVCPVCGMDADPRISSAYKGKTYYFCMQADKETFDASPERFVKAG